MACADAFLIMMVAFVIVTALVPFPAQRDAEGAAAGCALSRPEVLRRSSLLRPRPKPADKSGILPSDVLHRFQQRSMQGLHGAVMIALCRYQRVHDAPVQRSRRDDEPLQL
ncbi:hypothetical protein [Mesorhizobium sp. WSM4935]|uniref:hypothetical protein n=1 Tax=Mesorhizobium sp. WSM4935 TaxID=3038547 RepID=UPI0030148A7E